MKIFLGLILLLLVPEAGAQSIGIPAISVEGGSGNGETYTVTLEILALMTMLTLLPAILLMMTSFYPRDYRAFDSAPGARYCTDSFQSDYPGTGLVSDSVHHDTGA